MQNIALPKKIDFKKGDGENHGLITVEPLFPGYGMTLGNSLRRVLLSSLPGSAVIGVKIKGADHEFMSLPHIKEDMLEIILNIKQLKLEVFGEEEVKLELNVHGKKEVTAADITKTSNAEIKNPKLVLANITDMAGSLSIEIYANKGRGFQSVEATEKENKAAGYIQLDSIFSPVLSASVSVENARVGKMTNWDKLVLDVVTDGSVSPQEAFEQSVKILIEQFNSFLQEPVELNAKEKGEAKEAPEVKVEDPSTSSGQEKEEKEEAEATEEDEDDKAKKRRGRPKKEEK